MGDPRIIVRNAPSGSSQHITIEFLNVDGSSSHDKSCVSFRAHEEVKMSVEVLSSSGAEYSAEQPPIVVAAQPKSEAKLTAMFPGAALTTRLKVVSLPSLGHLGPDNWFLVVDVALGLVQQSLTVHTQMENIKTDCAHGRAESSSACHRSHPPVISARLAPPTFRSVELAAGRGCSPSLGVPWWIRGVLAMDHPEIWRTVLDKNPWERPRAFSSLPPLTYGSAGTQLFNKRAISSIFSEFLTLGLSVGDVRPPYTQVQHSGHVTSSFSSNDIAGSWIREALPQQPNATSEHLLPGLSHPLYKKKKKEKAKGLRSVLVLRLLRPVTHWMRGVSVSAAWRVRFYFGSHVNRLELAHCLRETRNRRLFFTRHASVLEA
ncbi:hypothetical protein M9458_051583, partial [Cirrhinus mrigala]